MHLHSIFSPLTLFVAALLYSLAAGAENQPYYTWVDEQGVTNFSQKNPKDVRATYVSGARRVEQVVDDPTLNRRPGKVEESAAPEVTEAAPAAAGAEESAEPRLGEEELTEEMAAERAAVQAEIAKARYANCSAGKRNLAKLEAYARIRIREEDGSERVLSDEEKAQRVANAKQMIADNC